MKHLSQSPTDPDFVQNPYPFYERARATGPVFFWEEYGIPMAVSATAVGAALRDRRLGRETPEALRQPVPPRLEPFYAIEAHSMLELEPPSHTRLRNLVLRAFTSRRIAGLAPEIATLAGSLADALPEGRFDLLPGFARALPVIVIARLLGVPEAYAEDLLRWSNAMVAMYQARRDAAIEAAAASAAHDFAAFLRDHIETRRRHPANDLITRLIGAEAEGERLSADEMIATSILLLNAGHEATVHTIGNGVKAMLEAGVGAEALTKGRIAATVEEMFRFDPPLHMFTRWAYEEIEIGGHLLRPGERIGLLLAAAGRDPGQWEGPEIFNPDRPLRPHLAFGAGLHFCLGAPLARLELQIALPILFARRPGLRLAAAPLYGDLYHFHGLERLELVSDRAG